VKEISIFNDVLGPVMRGPSSSHTAAPYHIGRLARSLLGDQPLAATFTFDPGGSFAEVYRQQGSDLGFVAGLMDWPLTGEGFPNALDRAAAAGVEIVFAVQPLPEADHPNTVEIKMRSRQGRHLRLVANSIGGGAIVCTRVEDWPVDLRGDAHEVLVVLEESAEAAVRELLVGGDDVALHRQAQGGRVLLHVRHPSALGAETVAQIEALPGVRHLWTAAPIFFGLESPPPMQLLPPSAPQIYRAEAEGRLALGGLHTRAAARAMAVMHVNGGMGVVCAAPTAGAAGTLPGVVVTLAEEQGLAGEKLALTLLAASGVGLIVARRATFAAEVAGCQVEIGAAGAMAAAAVVEAAGGGARQAADAAAIAFQNTMGLVCDLVQGIVEIPCHTRNAVAASSAFVCADLILGGYRNPIPLDETIDAVYAVGKMLPRELKVTALGGLAITPSAQALERLR